MILRTLMAMTILALAAPHMQAQDATPPATALDMEEAYAITIERRTQDIVQRLGIDDAAKLKRVHDAIITQYRTLRARDEAIELVSTTHAKDGERNPAERYSIQRCMSAPLHKNFIARLSSDLSPEQVEIVKNRMTYDKVKVTYDAYCAIVPGLTEPQKAQILEDLKQAREEAMDGGSAQQKTEIFQKYKDVINRRLNGEGHDVAKLTAEWNAKQELTSQTSSN